MAKLGTMQGKDTVGGLGLVKRAQHRKSVIAERKMIQVSGPSKVVAIACLILGSTQGQLSWVLEAPLAPSPFRTP